MAAVFCKAKKIILIKRRGKSCLKWIKSLFCFIVMNLFHLVFQKWKRAPKLLPSAKTWLLGRAGAKTYSPCDTCNIRGQCISTEVSLHQSTLQSPPQYYVQGQFTSNHLSHGLFPIGEVKRRENWGVLRPVMFGASKNQEIKIGLEEGKAFFCDLNDLINLLNHHRNKLVTQLLLGWNLSLQALQIQATDCSSPYLKVMKVLSPNVNTKLGFFGAKTRNQSPKQL